MFPRHCLQRVLLYFFTVGYRTCLYLFLFPTVSEEDQLLTRGVPCALLSIAMSLGLQTWDRAGTPWIGSVTGYELGVRSQGQERRITWVSGRKGTLCGAQWTWYFEDMKSLLIFK